MEYQILHPEITNQDIHLVLFGEQDRIRLVVTYMLIKGNYTLERTLRSNLASKNYPAALNVLCNLDSYIERLVARGLISVQTAVEKEPSE